MNSRQKGAAGERELAKKLREYGYDCRRGQQYCGANGDADVIGLEGIHIECKRVERLNIDDAMLQAIREMSSFWPTNLSIGAGVILMIFAKSLRIDSK